MWQQDTLTRKFCSNCLTIQHLNVGCFSGPLFLGHSIVVSHILWFCLYVFYNVLCFCLVCGLEKVWALISLQKKKLLWKMGGEVNVFQPWSLQKLIQMACILESWITLVHPHSRNKSDFTDLIFLPAMFCKLVTSWKHWSTVIGSWRLNTFYNYIPGFKNNSVLFVRLFPGMRVDLSYSTFQNTAHWVVCSYCIAMYLIAVAIPLRNLLNIWMPINPNSQKVWEWGEGSLPPFHMSPAVFQISFL